METFERLILSRLESCTSSLMNSPQFASPANRSANDTVDVALHHILQHLESSHNCACLLFIHFSSAFNAVNYGKLFFTLQHKNLTFWIFDSLSNIIHVVKVKNTCSQTLSLSTGTPQSCVLSPLLFSISLVVKTLLITSNMQMTPQLLDSFQTMMSRADIGGGLSYGMIWGQWPHTQNLRN